MKITLGPRTRGTNQVLTLVALVVFAAVTTGASSPRATRSKQASGSHHTFLTPPTSVEAGCSPDSALCLNEGRFKVEVAWTTSDGTSGSGHPVALTSDSGYFWFFDPNNVELTVKALNGCGINEHYWVFAGGLTNIEVTMTVTDTVTGEVKTYSNPQGNAFQPIIDTKAFGTCVDAAAISAANPEEPTVEASVTSPVRALEAARVSSAVGCVSGDTVLCVNGRFQVEAAWQTASGASGLAYAVPLTSESGYFWFFEPSNVELIVKSLNACSFDQGNWFFAAGMTTVGVQLKVTDTLTGEVKTYGNLLGTPFLPIQDTAAFPFCPTPTPTPTVTPTPTPTPTRTNPTHTPTPTRTPTPAPRVYTLSASCSRTFCASHSGTRCGFSTPPNTLSTLHVRVGDTVNWVWSSGVHSTTSGSLSAPDGKWDSGSRTGPFTFSHTFTRTGTFHYFCSPGHVTWSFNLGLGCLRWLSHEEGVVIVDP